MKNLLIILLFLPLATFSQELDSTITKPPVLIKWGKVNESVKPNTGISLFDHAIAKEYAFPLSGQKALSFVEEESQGRPSNRNRAFNKPMVGLGLGTIPEKNLLFLMKNARPYDYFPAGKLRLSPSEEPGLVKIYNFSSAGCSSLNGFYFIPVGSKIFFSEDPIHLFGFAITSGQAEVTEEGLLLTNYDKLSFD